MFFLGQIQEDGGDQNATIPEADCAQLSQNKESKVRNNNFPSLFETFQYGEYG
jgi:hypothetical protein